MMGDWHFPEHYTSAAKEFAVASRAAEIAVFVDKVLPSLRDTANFHGYALAVHGSLARDLDLVAIPWTEAAVDAETLIAALADTTREATGWGHISGRNSPHERTKKPHGRVAVTVLASAEVELDISITPRVVG